MKKITSILAFLCLFVLNASAAVSYELDKELTWDEVKDGATAFALVSGDKVLYGSGNQNSGFDAVTAITAETGVAVWKAEIAEGGFLFQGYNLDDVKYVCWGMGGWLNAQPNIGSITFILGLNNQNGQDMKNGAVWTVTPVDGGYTIQNVGNNGYLAGTNTSAEPTHVWKFYTLKKGAEIVEEAPVYVWPEGAVDLTADMFKKWTAPDATGEEVGAAGCAYNLNKADGLPYGDGNVYYLNYADLSAYSKLILLVKKDNGTPRPLFNRTTDGGPVIEYPKDNESKPWCTTETCEDGHVVYTYDIDAMVASEGFSHLHAIKGANWANVYVYGMKLVPGNYKYEDAIAVTPDVTPYANGQYPKPITKFTINPADGKKLSLTEEAFIEIKYNGQSDKTWNAEAIATATQEDGKIVLEYTTEKSGEYVLTVKKGSFIVNGDKYLMNDVSVSNYNVLLPSTELSVVEKSLDVEGGYIKFDEYIAFPDYAPNVTAKVIDASTEEEVCDATLTLDEDDLAKVFVSFATALEGGSYSLVISDGDVISEDRKGIVYHGAPIKFMIAGELVDCDLTKEMFMVWDNYDATAQPLGDGAGAYEIGVSSGLPYGNGSVLGNQFANLTGYSLLALTITDGAPRLLFNRPTMGDSGQSDYLEIKSADSPYVSIQGNVWYIDLAKITSEQGYAHLNAIKGANWANVTITEAKLLVNVPTAISGAETQSLKNGKFLQNGQIVIMKNGKAYNVMGIQK